MASTHHDPVSAFIKSIDGYGKLVWDHHLANCRIQNGRSSLALTAEYVTNKSIQQLRTHNNPEYIKLRQQVFRNYVFDFAVELYYETYMLQKRQLLDEGKDETIAENTARTLASDMVKGRNLELGARCSEFTAKWPELEDKDLF